MKQINKNKKFSLIELLTVLAITGVILGISIPAFNTLLKGESVEYASRTVLSMLKLARAYAITNEVYSAVIIIMNETGLPTGFQYSAYRVAELNSDLSFDKWIDGEKWEFLPTGASFIPKNLINSMTDNLSSITAVTDSPIGLNNAVDGISPIGLNNAVDGIIFKPSGECESNAKITIGSGTESGGVLIRTNSSNNVSLEVNRFTGRASYVDS